MMDHSGIVPRMQARLCYIFGKFIEFMVTKGELKVRKKVPTKVAIEAGIKGWEAVFFQEFLKSTMESLEAVDVIPISTVREENYVRQLTSLLKATAPTHLFLDPRSGSQNPLSAIIESIKVKLLLTKFGIIPVIILPDASLRRHRLQSILLAADVGVIVTFASSVLMKSLFYKATCIGPLPIPISKLRIDKAAGPYIPYSPEAKLTFVGSLYPSRVNFFRDLGSELVLVKSKLEIELVEKKNEINSEEYWKLLRSQALVITTNFQLESTSEIQDMMSINQMVFRISESLASCKLLFSMQVPGMDEYFEAGVHFVEYLNANDLAAKLEFYARNPRIQRSIAEAGYARYKSFQESKTFWKLIEQATDSKLVADNFN